MATDSYDVEAEMAAMASVRQTISALPGPARRRVLLWLADVFSTDTRNVHGGVAQERSSGYRPIETQVGAVSSFAEMLERAEPSNNADRVLVACYWLHQAETRDTVDGRSINKLLKEHGIDVSNVTNAFTALIERRPRLAIQAGKKGKFEKLYRLTTEGKKAVEGMSETE